MVKRILLFAVSLQLFSCGGQNGSVQESQVPEIVRTIGIAVSMSEDTPFFVSLVQGAGEAADMHGARILVSYAGEDPSLQIRQLSEMVDSGIDVLLLNPVNMSVAPAAERLAAAGIPVITIDRGISSDFISCHIASDNVAGGTMAGDYLAEVLFRRGRVVELRGTEGSSAAIERGQGFHNSMHAFPEVELVASVSAEFSRETARERFAEILMTHDKIDGVFAHNDDMILGAMDAAVDAEMGDIVFIGFDAIEEAVAAVEEGTLTATVAQRPSEMGRLGVETALDLLNGEEIPDSITVDLALISR